MTRTSTTTVTRTHTATHLAKVILTSVAGILAELSIDRTQLFGHWPCAHHAISNWIEEGSLECVVLECHQPGGAVSPILEFPVSYGSSGVGDRKFTFDRASLARYLAKLHSVPDGTSFRLLCTFNGHRSQQPGWGPAIRTSVSVMRAHSFGRLATAPHASANLRYLRNSGGLP